MFARQILLGAGIRIMPIKVDDQGLRVSDGIAQAPEARLVVTTPAHQSPLCVALSLPRRLALLEWAASQGAWIVEDDYDGEFHYGGRLLPALKSLDRDDCVIYAGSFSKSLFPGLRLGYLVCPMALVDRLRETAQLRASAPGQFMQAVVATFLDDGHCGRHINRMRRLYARRRATLALALAETFQDKFRIDIEQGGMHLIAQLRPGVSDKEITEHAATAGFNLQTLSAHSMRRRSAGGLLLSFTNVPENRAEAVCQKLYRAIGDRV